MLILQARLRLADTVEKEDVDEGMRLLEMSKNSLYDEEEFNTRYTIHVHVLVLHNCYHIIYIITVSYTCTCTRLRVHVHVVMYITICTYTCIVHVHVTIFVDIYIFKYYDT